MQIVETKELLPSWKFKNSWIPYNKLDKRGVLLAAFHCISLMNSNFRSIHYWEYKFNISNSVEFKQHCITKKDNAAKYLEYYSKQITHLENRAEELGFDLPDNKLEVSKLLKSDFPIVEVERHF
jgi:hypothetical protein